MDRNAPPWSQPAYTAGAGIPPELRLISDYAAWYARETPDAVAAVLEGEVITYAELSARVDRLACALIAAGLRPGDRLAMLSPPNPDFLIVFLATATVGAIWVGLNPKYRLPELLAIVEDCNPNIIVGRRFFDGRDYRDELEALSGSTRRLIYCDASPSLADLLREGDAVSEAALRERWGEVRPRDPCLIIYTSGSTGKPKGALLHHQGLILPALDEARRIDRTGLNVVNHLPINHIGCIGDITALAYVLGGKIAFLERFEVSRLLQLLAAERISLWQSVPSVFEMARQHPAWSSTDLSALKTIFWGGAAMAEATLAALGAVCPRVATNYGSTESCGPVTATGIMTIRSEADIADALASVGYQTALYDCRLRDDNGQEIVEPGIEGELEIRGEPIFLGYWERPEATEQAFTPDGWYRTGDLFERLDDGRLRISGRRSEMFKSGGYNVYPREIEQLLEAQPGVHEAAVVGVSHPFWGEVGIAYVAAEPDVQPATLLQACRAALANYKIPKHIEMMTELPRLPIGKVDKVHLRSLAGAVG
jgi:acyl-CoA synthetase (AMP-forming)/AMP-acid ligase II